MKEIYRSEPGQAQVGDQTYDWSGSDPVEMKNEHADLLLAANPELYSDEAPKGAAKAAKADGDKGDGK